VLNIEIDKVAYESKGNENRTVLSNLSLKVNENEFLCILGKSGCGKTTLLNAISGLVGYTGEIVCESFNEPKLGYIFQSPRLVPWKTVYQNISLVLHSKSNAEQQIMESLNLVGLQEYANDFPNSLSGGMQARVGIARAIVTKPNILLCDEPFSHLDIVTSQLLRKRVIELVHKLKATTIFVTHDPFEAVSIADRIAILDGSPATISEIIIGASKKLQKPGNEEYSHLLNRVYKGLGVE
jgi:NitT/TauT family transport system ATP-binding protein